MTDDEDRARKHWLGLLEDAQTALEKVIRVSKPGTGMELHAAYRSLGLIRERDAGPPAWREELIEQRNVWKRLSRLDRERLAIEVIGEKHLTVSELTARIESELGGRSVVSVYVSDVRPLLARLIGAGELDRFGEQWRGRTRYRYFRRTQLSGPIAELERMFTENSESGAD